MLRKPKEKEIGVITHYFSKISVGVIKLKASLRVGDRIHIKGTHDGFVQIVNSMQINRQDVPSALGGHEVGIKVAHRVYENDKVYRVTDA
ncbi:MAG: translation elongation factor-like protein [Candidatus Omnitrophota bacterium]|nr:MAG: translation elongation factor-like protein [Candidatus Omnitrophota bacterium]